MPLSRVSLVKAALKQRGFVEIDRPRMFDSAVSAKAEILDLWFAGQLKAAKGQVSAYISVPDLSFVESPSVWLPERPTWLVGWRPHLLGTDALELEGLCYNDFEKYQLLPSDPGAAVLRVIEDAQHTLNRISTEASVVEDSRKDLARLWPSTGLYAYTDVVPQGRVLRCKAGYLSDKQMILVSNDPLALAAKLGFSGKIPTVHTAILYPDSAQGLYLTSKGPPKDLLEVKNWLEETSPQTFKLWHQQIQTVEHYKDGVGFHFFVTQGQLIGYQAFFRGARRIRSAREVRAIIADKIYKHPEQIFRMHAERVDDEYLVRRNLAPETPDLRGKRVLLIGAGAIGGYIAPALMQLGAGARLGGRLGQLVICDRDSISPGNVGRHVLGLGQINKNKAAALRDHLISLRPGIAVEAFEGSFYSLPNSISDFDLVIDATGYEAFSRHVSKLARRGQWLAQGRALVHTWIEGRGGVVRGLLQDSKAQACYDCLWNYTPGTEPSPRYAAYSENSWNEHSDDGYATMTPFAVSAPMAAAALATELVLAWRSTKVEARFRSRSVEAPGVNPSIAKNLKKANKCPGCSESN